MKTSGFFSAGVVAVLLGATILASQQRALAQRPMGIDVSHYQSVINWTNVAGGGITFAWCKGTEGLNYVDPTFVSNVLHAKAVSIPIGLYHFARPDVNVGLPGADAEAAFFWSTISNYVLPDGVSMMPMLDFEQDVTGANPAYTKATLSAWVNEWCNALVNHAASNGVTITPIVYTYTSYSTGTSGNGPGMDNSVTNWPLWMASYNGRNPQTGNPSSTSPWSAWQFWQYSSSLTVPGINNGSCDTDVFNGTAAGLANYIVGGPPNITNQPSNVTVIEGGTANFSVAATTSPLTYQWSFNGTSINGATNSALTVSNTPQSAAGPYSVAVTGPVGTTISSNAVLTVIPMVTNVVVMPRSSSAIITWSSSTNASGQAMYSLDTSYGSVLPLAPALTTQHSALLVGLQPATTYNFQLVSSNSPFGGAYTGSFSTDVSLIVQSAQAAYSGIWTVASAAPDKYSPYYEYAATVNGSDTALAFFRPNIISAGKYDVYLWYSQGSNRSHSAPVTVSYQGASVQNFVDESTNGGSWQLLVADVPFAAGTNGYIRLGNATGESGKVVIADAVKLVYSAGQDVPANNSPPSWWLGYYFGTNSVVPSQDADGDGYSALAEYVIGTDPTNPISYLHVRGEPTADGNGVQVIFSPYYFNAGRQYQLQSCVGANGGAWTNLPLSTVTTNVNGEGVLTVTNLAGSQNFLRVSVLMTQ